MSGVAGDTATTPIYTAPGLGVTQVNASSGNVAAGTASATLAAVSGKTNYLSGFSLTSSGATAASVVTGTVTGILGGTLSFTQAVVAGATLANAPLNVSFNPPLAASAPNVAIVVSFPSLGAGNTNTTVNAFGYQQ